MKKNKFIYWIATIIILLWEGLMPLGTILFAPEYVNLGTKPLGYPDYFAHWLIVCKVLGVAAIVYPKNTGKASGMGLRWFNFQPDFRCHQSRIC